MYKSEYHYIEFTHRTKFLTLFINIIILYYINYTGIPQYLVKYVGLSAEFETTERNQHVQATLQYMYNIML